MHTDLAGFNPHRQESTSRMQPDDDAGMSLDMRRGRILFDRLDERLKALGLSDNAASEQTGKGRDLIRDLRRNPDRSPLLETMLAIAEVLHCSIDYLTDRSSTETDQMQLIDRAPADSVPVIGLVGAELWQNPARMDKTPLGLVKVVKNYASAEPEAYALKVVGDGFNRLAPDGSHVIVIPDDGREPRDQEMVVVRQQRDGLVERSLRRVVRTAAGFELHPESTDATFQKILYEPGQTIIEGLVDMICIRPMKA